MERTILTHPLNGGVECDILYSTAPCTVMDVCDGEPVECEYTEWELDYGCDCVDPYDYWSRTVV